MPFSQCSAAVTWRTRDGDLVRTRTASDPLLDSLGMARSFCRAPSHSVGAITQALPCATSPFPQVTTAPHAPRLRRNPNPDIPLRYLTLSIYQRIEHLAPRIQFCECAAQPIVLALLYPR